MAVVVELLGRPNVVGSTRQPARKSWAVLAYLILAGPAPRRRLADLLFAEADDPLRALRWALSDLRGALGDGVVGTDDPVVVASGRLDVDVAQLERGDWRVAVAVAGFGRELLEGVDPASGAAFEMWLLAERQRVVGLTSALLHEAALASLAAGDHDTATGFARRLVQLDALSEDAQALLVRCLVAADRRGDAVASAATAEKILTAEHGIHSVAQIRRALRTPPPRRPAPSPVAIAAALELGQASVNAGAVAEGMEALERAATMARGVEDPRIRVDAFLTLGSALVHAARGNDEEGAAFLHEAAGISEELTDGHRLVAIWRELGWIAFLRGEYERAHHWLGRAGDAASDASDRAWIDLVAGACASDQGLQDEAMELLSRAIGRAQQVDDLKAVAFARSFRGRSRLLTGDRGGAAEDLDAAVDDARRAQWISVMPWPLSLRSEVFRLDGDTEQAAEFGARAFELGCRIGDPCWEGMGGRAVALAGLRGGDPAGADDQLKDARQRAVRLPDTYAWARLWIDQARCALALRRGADDAALFLDALQLEAATRGMRGLVDWTFSARNDSSAANQILGSG